jgi:hypothetical protein
MSTRNPGFALLTLLLVLPSLTYAADKPTTKPDAPFGVPGDEAVAKATKLIKETFARDYAAATTLPLRTALAQRLLKEALETRDDTPARYVLLCESRDLAARAADAPTACRAIEQLAKVYGVAPGEMTLAALSTAARLALTPQTQESLARCALAAVDAALSRDDYELAARLAGLAESVATKTRKLILLTDAQDKVKEVNWAANEFAQARSALEALTTRPDDATAKGAAGRFKCLVKGDWEHGLPLLLECNDAQLKHLAERDQAAITAPPDVQKQIGDQWWELGEQYLQRARLACRTRAAYWYQRAVPKLSGIHRTVSQQRLEELDLARLREMNLQPGLAGEVFADKQFGTPYAKQVDARLDAEWPAKARTTVPRDDFSIRWAGYLRAPAAGKYTLGLLVNDGARVYIDDQLALEEPKGTQKRKSTQNTITLTAGLHPIRIEFWDTGGLARIHLSWRIPGSTVDEIIPARAFVHEIGTGQ